MAPQYGQEQDGNDSKCLSSLAGSRYVCYQPYTPKGSIRNIIIIIIFQRINILKVASNNTWYPNRTCHKKQASLKNKTKSPQKKSLNKKYLKTISPTIKQHLFIVSCLLDIDWRRMASHQYVIIDIGSNPDVMICLK